MAGLTRRGFLAASAVLGASIAFPAVRLGRTRETPVKTVVLIMQENRSFDHYFGLFPGADGLPFCSPVERARTATDADPPHDAATARAERSQPGTPTFERVAGDKALNYYTGAELPYYWALAHRFTLCDRYFSAVLGPTRPNRLFSVAAAPGDMSDSPQNQGNPDSELLPRPTLMDRLDERRVDWACYVAHRPPGLYNSVAYYPERRQQPQARRSYSDFLADASAGRLPSVTWVVSAEYLGEHPPDPVTWGERFVALTINTIASSPQWKETAIILSYDESGGFYDHVVPPKVDDVGYGFRVPSIVVSPYARAGHVSNETYDHSSMIAFVERVFGLRDLGHRDVKANPFEDCFDFTHRQNDFVDYRPDVSTLARTTVSPPSWATDLFKIPVPRGHVFEVPESRRLCGGANPPASPLAPFVIGGAGISAAAAASALAIRRARRGGWTPRGLRMTNERDREDDAG